MSEKKNKIGNIMAFALIIVAVAFDLLEIVLTLLGGVGLLINRAVVVFKWAIFWLWLKILGVSITKKPSRLAISGITFLLGMIPVIGTLPEFTIGIALLVISTRSDIVKSSLGIVGISTPTKNNRVRKFKRGSHIHNNKKKVIKNTRTPLNNNITRQKIIKSQKDKPSNLVDFPSQNNQTKKERFNEVA